MAKIQTNCPRCRQPLVADVEQLFDVSQDPDAKRRILSGQFNVARCQSCGYEGGLAVPVVYHDPDKELLLTYFPPELSVGVNEQEKMIGPIISSVMNRLPAEKRKAYLLQPRTMLTLQTLVDTILEADGITKDMIEAQQKRVGLLQRIITASSADVRADIVKQEEALIDNAFFTILSTLIQNAMQGGDERAARVLATIQQELLQNTAVGRQLMEQSKETEAAIKDLQDASKDGLTHEKLLDLIVNSPSPIRVAAYVSLARSGLDYTFFQLLSERINAASGEAQDKLIALRDQLLDLTREVDEALAARRAQATALLNQILAADNIESSAQQHLAEMDDFFAQALRNELELAQRNNDAAKLQKLSRLMSVLEAASAPPPEVGLIQELIQAKDDAGMEKILADHQEMVTPEFLEVISAVIHQSQEQGQPPELVERLKLAYRAVQRFTMKANLSKPTEM